MLSINDMSKIYCLVRFAYNLKPHIKHEIEKQEPATVTEVIKNFKAKMYQIGQENGQAIVERPQ